MPGFQSWCGSSDIYDNVICIMIAKGMLPPSNLDNETASSYPEGSSARLRVRFLAGSGFRSSTAHAFEKL
jgi:hypothetical protein